MRGLAFAARVVLGFLVGLALFLVTARALELK